MKMKLWLTLLAAGGLVFLSSCDKDEEPKKIGISFATDALEVNESDGTVESFHPDIADDGTGKDYEVQINLDGALSETVVLQYSLSGTASDDDAGDLIPDFEIKEGDNTIVGSDKITIEKGATSASIIVTVYEDYELDVDDDNNALETIILELESVSSGPAVLGETTTYTLSVKEDDVLLFLLWNVAGTEEIGDVDLDLFMWLGEDLWDASVKRNATSPEFPFEAVLIPAGLPDEVYGLSYTYYAGTADEVDFASVMFGNVNGEYYPYFSEEDDGAYVSGGTYTLANKNKWDEDGAELPKIVQNIEKDGPDFFVDDIVVPSSGSRVGGTRPVTLKQLGVTREMLRKINFTVTGAEQIKKIGK